MGTKSGAQHTGMTSEAFSARKQDTGHSSGTCENTSAAGMGIGSKHGGRSSPPGSGSLTRLHSALGDNDTEAPMSESISKRAPENETRPLSVAQQEKGPANNKIVSRESDLGTQLQETDTSTKGLDKSYMMCYVWHTMDHHHDGRHSDAHLDPRASQKLARGQAPVSVLTLADTHGNKKAKCGNKRNTMRFQSSKTRNHDCATQFTQISTYGEQPGNSSGGSEQRHAIHKVDGPVKKAIRSQSIRTQKDDNTTHTIPWGTRAARHGTTSARLISHS